MNKKQIAQWSVRWHRSLRWFAGATLLIWAFSGMLHPLMSWTGPRPQNFYPPKYEVSPLVFEQHVASALDVLNQSAPANTKLAKLVASESGPVLQVTGNERRYFDLNSGQESLAFDSQQAQWLANYYSGKTYEQIASTTFITEFSAEYPWVNRLLPVYRVAYEGDDNLVLFVHTETSALAGITNDRKSAFQFLFRALHTWNWLDNIAIARVFVIALLIATLIFITVTGIAMIFSFSERKIKDGKRRWHRTFAYSIWLPILAWSVSGFYHLLQAEFVVRPVGMTLDKPLSLSTLPSRFELSPALKEKIRDTDINVISFVRGERDEPLLRFSVAQTHTGAVNRAQQYSGAPREKSSFYVDLRSGEIQSMTDRDRALWLASEHKAVDPSEVKNVSLVTRFGGGYDFRNKRLPVWKVHLADENVLFIDPITGILVDQSRAIDRAESWSFSYLHKWNFLTPFVGRMVRDLIIVLVLMLAMGFSILGLVIKVRKKKERPVPVPELGELSQS